MGSTLRATIIRLGLAVGSALGLAALPVLGNGNMDPDAKTAWSENAGWINFEPANGGVTVHYDGRDGYLSGYAWAENVGWIKLGHDSGGPYGNTNATDWGVNLEAGGALTGHAWGENIGWVRFNPTYSQVTVDTATGRFSADAWGENIGWIRFEGATPFYSVRTRAFDTRPLGTPNWWLAMHGIAETTDTDGDGLREWQEYIAGTIPTNAASLLAIVALDSAPHRPLTGPATNRVYFDSVTKRLYKLEYITNPLVPPWQQVPGQWGIPGNGGRMALVDINATEQRFYRIGVRTW